MSDEFCQFDEQTLTFTAANSNFVPDPKGIGHAFFTQMQRNRHKIAQYDVETGVEETFGNLFQRCVRTAIEMRSRGIGPGDIVSICAPNSLDNYVPYIATQFLGAVVASLDPTSSLQDTNHMMKLVEPKMIFVAQACEELIENAVNDCKIQCEIVVIGDSNKYATFEQFQQVKTTEKEFVPHEVNDLNTTSVILFTSGTTGLAKGICLNHNSQFEVGHRMILSGCALERILTFATTYWVSTMNMISVMCVFGKCRCIVKTFNPKELWHQIERAALTFFILSPTSAVHLLKEGRPDGVDTTTLRDVMIAGASFSVENHLALRDLLPGTNLLQVFGLSECGGITHMFQPADRKQLLWSHSKPGSTGRLMPGLKCKVVDPETDKPVGLNCPGELRCQCVGMMNGYYKMDSSHDFDADGFIRSGDIVYIDEDLCLFVVDRIKDMIKYQGFHLSPMSIETVLISHPKVHSAAVIGLPHAVDGDHPMGLVILQPGQVVKESELVAYVKERVDDRHQLRAGVRILNAFPYTPSGKVKKSLLRQKILAGEL